MRKSSESHAISQRRLQRIGTIAIVLGSAVGIGCGATTPAVPSNLSQSALPQANHSATPLSTQDEIEIFAAVIRRIVERDDTYGGRLRPSTLYVQRMTDESVGDPVGGNNKRRALSEEIQQGVQSSLSGLATRLVWIDKFEDAPRNNASRRVANGGAIVTLGNIVPQSDGTVHLSGGIYVADLAAGGRTYVLSKQRGQWSVSGTTGSRWIS